MEQQKILWITLSVAVLLLVVLASTLFIFGSSPGSAQTARVSDMRSDRAFDPIEWARTGSEYPTLNDTALQNDNDGNFVISGSNAVNPGQGAVVGSAATEDTGNIVSLPVRRIEQPRTHSVAPAAPAVAVAPSPTVSVVPAPAAPPSAPPASSSSAAPASPAPVRRADSETRPVPAPAAPAPRITTVTEYWIQTNSFSTVARAEEERRIITSKGFPAIIQTRIIGDDTFYRVRVGAYSSRAEAEKFLLWIKNSGFESSQIFEVTARREI